MLPAERRAYGPEARSNMAKTPRKSQDPTQAALSAIEEALQMGDAPAVEPAGADDARRGRDSVPMPSSAIDEPPSMRRRQELLRCRRSASPASLC